MIAQIEEIAKREFAPFIADPRNLQNINEAGVRRLYELNDAHQSAQREAQFAQVANAHLEQKSLKTYYGEESAKFIKAHPQNSSRLVALRRRPRWRKPISRLPSRMAGLASTMPAWPTCFAPAMPCRQRH